MRRRGTSCRPVSVCLSVTLMYCIQAAEDVDKLLSRRGSPVLRSSGVTQFDRNSLSGAVKMCWKILRFSTDIAVYLGNGTM